MMSIMLIAIYVVSIFTAMFFLCYEQLENRDVLLSTFIKYLLISLVPIFNTIMVISYSVMYYFDNMHDIVIFEKRDKSV